MTVATRREKSVSESYHYQQSSRHWWQGLCHHQYRHFQTYSRQNWQPGTRTASKRWEIDLVKEIRRGVKVGDSLSSLIIEVHRIKFWCTHLSSSFRKGLRQYHELMQRIKCCIDALINIARIIRVEYCLGLWLWCSRWWNQAYSEVADGAWCKREGGINKVYSVLYNSSLSMTNHKNRSVGVLLQGSEPQEDTSLNSEGYWNRKHPGGIAI